MSKAYLYIEFNDETKEVTIAVHGDGNARDVADAIMRDVSGSQPDYIGKKSFENH